MTHTVPPVPQLPLYKCHKRVRAVKIHSVERDESESYRWILFPDDPSIPMFEVPEQWVLRHTPIEGGYLVVYEDGYLSYSPAWAFENGYTRETTAPVLEEFDHHV